MLFNELASTRNLDWQAESRGTIAGENSRNVGPISRHVLKGLADRDLYPARPMRDPLPLTGADLAQADLIIALYDSEHRPQLALSFPEWVERVEYWQVPDLDHMPAVEALELIEQNVRTLIDRLAR